MSGKYQAYLEYKESGLQWLGKMPSHWELIKSKYLFNKVQREVHPNDGIVTAFRDGQVTLRINRRTDGFTNAVKEIGYQGVKKGDLLVHAMDGFAGAIGVSDSDGKCSPVCSVCIPNKSNRINMHYYGYLVRQLAVTDFITSLAKGIRERSTEFRFNEFAALDLAVPTLNEQVVIANFLDHETAKIDVLIEKQQQLIQLLQEKRQAVISHAVTKGLNPNAPMRDSGVEWMGEVPEHWRITKLGQLALMQEGPGLRTWQFKDQGTRVICVTNITEDGIDFSKLEKFISNEEYLGNYQHFTVNTGDILLSSSGNSWGKVAKYHGEEKVILNTSTIRLNELPHKPLLLDFIQNFLLSEACREQLGVAMTGSCQPNFGPTHLKEVRTPIPPEDEQDSINKYISEQLQKYDQPLKACEQAIKLMIERRIALISAAVTGKIDVRSWQAPDALHNNTENDKEEAA